MNVMYTSNSNSCLTNVGGPSDKQHRNRIRKTMWEFQNE